VNEWFHLPQRPLLLPVSQEKMLAHLLKVHQQRRKTDAVTIKIKTRTETETEVEKFVSISGGYKKRPLNHSFCWKLNRKGKLSR
jgi:predicted SPOUT superfamily RNA methylase MTH1